MSGSKRIDGKKLQMKAATVTAGRTHSGQCGRLDTNTDKRTLQTHPGVHHPAVSISVRVPRPLFCSPAPRCCPATVCQQPANSSHACLMFSDRRRAMNVPSFGFFAIYIDGSTDPLNRRDCCEHGFKWWQTRARLFIMNHWPSVASEKPPGCRSSLRNCWLSARFG